MGFDNQELRKIVNFCKKNGIIQYRNADFEIKLSVRALRPSKSKQSKVPVKVEKPEELNDEDMLFWSSTPIGVGQ